MNQAFAADINTLKTKLDGLRSGGATPDLRLSTVVELRKKLVAAIDKDDLKWFDIDLKMKSRTGPALYSIQVCSPVVVAGFYVPVSAKDTWELAVTHGAMPFTQAVADQYLNAAADAGKFVEMKTQPYSDDPKKNKLMMFDEFSDTLDKTAYKTEYGTGPVSGSHKLWMLSTKLAEKNTCNYGMYHLGARPSTAEGGHGPYLYPEYSVQNGLIRSGHDWGYWDYSQLLQLMKGLKEGVTMITDLRKAIQDKHEAIWDESLPFDSGQFPGTKKTFFIR